MLKAVASFFVRSLIELGLACLIAAALFLFVAYKTARRFATDTPDGFDKLAGRLASALGLVSYVRDARRYEPDDEEPDDEEPYMTVATNGRDATDDWEGFP